MSIPLRRYQTMDPYILASAVNMMLRDGEYEGLDDLCAAQEIDRHLLEERLRKARLRYDEHQKQFK